MTAIDNFVASDLVPCVNLKQLDIGSYTTLTATNAFSATFPDHSIQLNEFTLGVRNAMAIMNISTAQHLVIDFGSLAKITIKIEKDDDVEASDEFFSPCEQLTDVSISCKRYLSHHY